jgi:hypothetical protein
MHLLLRRAYFFSQMAAPVDHPGFCIIVSHGFLISHGRWHSLDISAATLVLLLF